MELNEAIINRRSVRVFEDKKIPLDVIREIVDLSKYYPSWKNTQTARFMLVVDKDKKKEIAETAVLGFSHNTNIINGTPQLMILLTLNGRSGYERDGSPTTSKGSHFQSFDAGAAAYLFQLAAYSKGIGSVVLGIYDEKKIKEILSIGDEYSISCLIPLGYPSGEFVMPKRHDVDEILNII